MLANLYEYFFEPQNFPNTGIEHFIEKRKSVPCSTKVLLPLQSEKHRINAMTDSFLIPTPSSSVLSSLIKPLGYRGCQNKQQALKKLQ
ncbi:hypothetical protein ACTXT7_005212 [Hymenolepis weldensis]